MASQPKFTAGPWTADEPGLRFRHDNSAGIKGPNGMYVATALDFNRTDREAEVEANARLIAAAPDLLAALKARMSPAVGEAEIEACFAAIDKAEGRS